MMKRFLASFLILMLILFTEGSITSLALAAPSSQQTTLTAATKQLPNRYRNCELPQGPRMAHCHSIVEKIVAAPPTNQKLTTLSRTVQPHASAPTGGSAPYTPVNLHNAYNLPYTAPNTQTIAVVSAYDHPNAELDLAIYRGTFGLPACTVNNGCFRKLNQNGQTSPLPPANSTWALETALDLDMVSAICTNCNILLIVANSSSLTDLGTGVNTAVSLGANIVTNSYGSNGEFAGEQSFCTNFFAHPNVAIVASTGDNGLQVNIPAACPNVVAVGGTTLNTNGNETAWSGAGGGCSTIITKQYWQNYQNTNCANRAVADVSAVANPATGVYTYYNNNWYQMGGTSAAAPIIAGVYGLAGNASSISNPEYLPWIFSTTSLNCLNPVPTGSTVKYNYQTGLGTPNGISCF